MPELTERQRLCLEGFIARKTGKQIGRELGITHHAVEKHLKAVRDKLGTADTYEAARMYLLSANTSAGPYYRAAEVSAEPPSGAITQAPDTSRSLVRDVATDVDNITIEKLSASHTIFLIVASGAVLIVILCLIVAVANGVKDLTQ